MRGKLILTVVLWAGIAHAGNEELFGKLKALPDVVEVVAMKTDSMFGAGYELRVRQPLDHAHPGGPTFLQSVYVAHVDESKPVIFETEGYSVRGGGRPRELASDKNRQSPSGATEHSLWSAGRVAGDESRQA